MSHSNRALRLRSAMHTSIGQVRENNEDNQYLSAQETWLLAVIADGMGGAAAGEEASRMAIEAVDNMLQEHEDLLTNISSDEQIIQVLRKIIFLGNTGIVQQATEKPEMRGMGTTITMAYVNLEHAIFAHVGDSRAYLIEYRSHNATQITNDHTFAEVLVSSRHLTREQADEHPMRNVLYRVLGQQDELEIDIYETRFHAGDGIVLCSDGLTRHVKPHEIADIVLANPDPELACNVLIDLANERGGEDNISVIVIRVEGSTETALEDSTVELKPVEKVKNTMSQPHIIDDEALMGDAQTPDEETPPSNDDENLNFMQDFLKDNL